MFSCVNISGHEPDYANNPLVTVADLKLHGRITTTNEDALILEYLTAACERAQKETRRSLGSQQWTLTLDAFPYENYGGRIVPAPIRLLHPPVVSVDSFTYLDENGAQQTMTLDTDYLEDLNALPPRLMPLWSQSWPPAQNYFKTVVISYTAGYAAGKCPAPILQAIRLIAQTWYENRDSIIVGTNAQELPIPVSASAQLAKYAVVRF